MHRTGGSLRDPRAITDRRFDEERQRRQSRSRTPVDHLGRRPDGPRLSLHRRGRDQQETRNPKRLLPMGKSLRKTSRLLRTESLVYAETLSSKKDDARIRRQPPMGSCPSRFKLSGEGSNANSNLL